MGIDGSLSKLVDEFHADLGHGTDRECVVGFPSQCRGTQADQDFSCVHPSTLQYRGLEAVTPRRDGDSLVHAASCEPDQDGGDLWIDTLLRVGLPVALRSALFLQAQLIFRWRPKCRSTPGTVYSAANFTNVLTSSAET